MRCLGLFFKLRSNECGTKLIQDNLFFIPSYAKGFHRGGGGLFSTLIGNAVGCKSYMLPLSMMVNNFHELKKQTQTKKKREELVKRADGSEGEYRK